MRPMSQWATLNEWQRELGSSGPRSIKRDAMLACQRDELLGKGVVVTVGNITIDFGPEGTAPRSPA
jgi:hypothetical protein